MTEVKGVYHYMADDLGLHREYDRILANMHNMPLIGIGFNFKDLEHESWIENWDMYDIEESLENHAAFDEFLAQHPEFD